MSAPFVHRTALRDLTPRVAVILQSPLWSQPVVIREDNFLIGSSPACDLVIDQPGFPTVHSVVHLQETVAWIEAFEDGRPLVINGLDCRRRPLRQGDHLELGGVRCEVLVTADLEALSRHDREEQLQATFRDEIMELSVAELCARIEHEQRAIRDFEQRQSRGLENLLAAIAEAVDPPDVVGVAPAPALELPQVEPALAPIGEFDHPTLARIEMNAPESATVRLSRESPEVARPLQLDANEGLAVPGTAIHDAQQRLRQQIDELIAAFDPVHPLRASA